MERQYLIGPEEIQGIFSADGERKQWLVAAEGDEVVLFLHPQDDPYFWPRGEGTTLVPRPRMSFSEDTVWVAAVDVPEGTASARLDLETHCWYTWDRDANSEHIRRSAVRNPPGGWEKPPQEWEKDYTVPGERLEGGAVLFRIPMPDEQERENFMERNVLRDVGDWNSYRQDRKALSAEIGMEAVFYDAGGAELGRAALSTRK